MKYKGIRKKRKGCQNCTRGKIIHDRTSLAELGVEKFPEVVCALDPYRLRNFGADCEKHEYRKKKEI